MKRTDILGWGLPENLRGLVPGYICMAFRRLRKMEEKKDRNSGWWQHLQAAWVSGGMDWCPPVDESGERPFSSLYCVATAQLAPEVSDEGMYECLKQLLLHAPLNACMLAFLWTDEGVNTRLLMSCSLYGGVLDRECPYAVHMWRGGLPESVLRLHARRASDDGVPFKYFNFWRDLLRAAEIYLE